jgi:hypothetical protein
MSSRDDIAWAANTRIEPTLLVPLARARGRGSFATLDVGRQNRRDRRRLGVLGRGDRFEPPAAEDHERVKEEVLI